MGLKEQRMKIFFMVLLVGLILSIPGCKQSEEITDPGPEPEKPEITGRLMTDAEMVNREDPNAPFVKPEWSAWIKDNVNQVRSLTYAGDFSDLQFLKTILAGRSIVQLGESGHGVQEFNKIKVRLIQFLHEEMGFDVIAFESCIYSCFYADHMTNATAEELMKGSIYGVWRTEELLELFDYILETRKTSNPLILAGFDMKPSSYSSTLIRPLFLKGIIEVIDADYAEAVYQYDQELVNNSYISPEESDQFFLDNESALKEFYGQLLTFVDDNMDVLLNAFPNDRRKVLVTRQTVWSILQNIDKKIALINNTGLATFYRDSAMAENLACLAEQIHPGKKIMVWAHNFHIRHRQEDIDNIKTMGHWVVDRFRSQLYTVGLYMYRGEAAWNNQAIYSISTHSADSLEAIGYQARLRLFFLDMLYREQVPGNSWMFMETESKRWGTYAMDSILRDQYDGIIFVDTVHPPVYR